MATNNAPIDHIVLGVDDGGYSWDSLEMAKRLAESVGAELHAFHATADKLADSLVDRAFQAQVSLKSATTFPGSDGVARGLVDHVAELDNAVAALTSHARRGLGSALLGSSAAATLQVSADPVLLFGPHHEADGAVTRVLACVDGSDLSESIVPAACRWAQASNSPLWLVHVVETSGSIVTGGADSNYLNRLLEDLDAGDLVVEFDVLHGDHPGRSIADYANTQDGTLTALATHGRSGLREITMGSVAMEVTRRSQGPTLVMHPG